MEWIRDLTEENFLSVYDVALDIRADAQLGNVPCVQMVPPVVRFIQLMPLDGINMRDRYGNLRWKAMKFLETKGIILKIELLKQGHRWETQAKLHIDQGSFDTLFSALELEAGRRNGLKKIKSESPSIDVPVSVTEVAPIEFEKVTLLWLVRHLPLKLWVSAISIICLIFFAGIQIGQLSLVQEYLGKNSQENFLEPAILKDRIDHLTEGYNKNVQQITAQILVEEDWAGRSPFTLEQQPHIEAANRLRSLLENEHKKYREAIKELRELRKSK